MEDDSAETETDQKTGRLEWVVGIVAALLVTATIGFLLYQSVSGGGGHPELHVEVRKSADFANSGHLRFAVFNSGDKAASHVVVSAVQRQASGMPGQKSRVEIDYVPANSNASGGLYVDPEAEVTVTVEGYVDP